MADPAWFNVPWSGHSNTVVAKITNNGDLAAQGVIADFSVKNYTVGGAPEVPLGRDTHDIPARDVVEFTTNWVPPDGGHFCVIVRIQPYIVPGTVPPVLEMSVSNNWAQTNYDRFISASASPASREITSVDVKTPFEERTQVIVFAGQTNPLYRTYLEHTSIRLEPKEARKIKVMHEFDPTNVLKCPISLGKGKGSFLTASGDDSNGSRAIELIKKYTQVPNRGSFVAFINPRDKTSKPIGMSLFSGVQNEVVTGRKTKFESFYPDRLEGQPGYFIGRVVVDASPNDSEGVTGGKVIIAVTNEERDEIRARSYATVKVDVEGRFVAKYDEQVRKIKAGFARAYYVPAPGYGDCWSKKLTLEGV